VRRLGKGRAAIAATLAVAGAMFVAPAAEAAVVTQTPLVGYQPNNTVRDMIVVGNTAYIGGSFTALTPPGGATAVTRNHVAAINMTTGALLPWNPNANGTVYTILPAGNNVYLGGSFTTVGGVTHKNIAEVDNTNGALITAFANTSRPNKAVRAMVIAGGNLYIGGAFTKPRNYMAELNATTNAYIPTWAPVVDAEVRALATDTSQTRIVEGGFQQCPTGSGCDGRIGIGAVNTTDGAFVPFAYSGPPTFIPPPGFPYRPFQVIQMTQDGNTLFASGTGNGGTALSLNMEDGTLNWQAGFNGNVVGIGVTDGVVYAGGHYSDYCGPVPGNNFFCSGRPGWAARSKLSAFDEATGAIEPWAPTVNTALGIEAVGADQGRVAVGGEFTRISGVTVNHFARFAP
jgi:trimeric autotransporter adhesin